MSWGGANRPKVTNKLGRPIGRDGADGDIQIKGTGLGAKLFAKWSGRWWDVPLSIDGVTKIGITDSDYLSIDLDSVDIYKKSVKVAEFGEDIRLLGGSGTEVFKVANTGKVTINATADTTIGLDITGTANRFVTIRSNTSNDTNNKLLIGTQASVDTGSDAVISMDKGAHANDVHIMMRAGSDFWKIGAIGEDRFEIQRNGTEALGIDSSGEVTIESGSIALKERATPTAISDYGKIYTKNTNSLFFQDGAGTEHEISFTDHSH